MSFMALAVCEENWNEAVHEGKRYSQTRTDAVHTLLPFMSEVEQALYAQRYLPQRGLATSQSTPKSADCPTCLSAMVSDPITDLVRLDVASRICEPDAPAPLTEAHADLDHPPRTI